MVLYPAADPNAKWTFKAGIVKYNPDSRSSVATELSEGQRLVKGKLDLSLYAKEITIDSNDNLQTQTARIFIPEGCWGLKLGREGAAPVQIDQNAGYRAPFIDVNSTSSSYTGEDFIASFDMRNTDSRHNHDRVLDESVRSCNSVKAGIQQ